ncbi:hypothetical protein [Sphingomonas crusticola]|uniref:hypothetical protein n=1 Tax=Sphingomonas crusticola TaxID=1697973 RepID=UPI000E268598|nr:hypothetical protein [Sphingomonas crusticola]
MPDPNRVMADAEALLQRVSPEGRRLAQRARQRRRRALMKALGRAIAASVVIILAAIAVGFVFPIGQMGFLAALIALAIAWVAIFAMSHEPEETAQSLAVSDITLLPQKTEAWLQRQRPALPAPAQRLADGIGLKLEALAPQLINLDPREPAAAEVRKLLATELPELIDGYTRVPVGLRTDDRHGVAPDKQLIEALGVVDSELARMSADLATGDLQKLATQGRYLELKYKDDQSL